MLNIARPDIFGWPGSFYCKYIINEVLNLWEVFY